METEVITIDGPTSSGKNSVGFLLAQKLGYQYIDSGSIYRAGCIIILRNNISLNDLERIVGAYKNLQIEVKEIEEKQRFIVNGEDVTENLHDSKVTQLVPIISAKREVREVVKTIQYQLVNSKNTVMTGRDIGSEIFPNAKYKFYITADVRIRADRRFKQLEEKDSSIRYDDVLQDMKKRDQADTTREISPLRIPENAIVVDSSNLGIEETVEEMLKVIKGEG